MAKATPIIAAFNAGEWTPLLDGRVDLAGYGASGKTIENFIATVQGPIVRRGGTRFVTEVKSSANRTWLVPFQRSRAVSYQIEFGDQYCRFYFNRALVLSGSPATLTGATQADPVVVTTSASHGYSSGQDVFISDGGGMTEIGGRWFIARNVTATTFELEDMYGTSVDGTGFTAYSSGGSCDIPLEIVSPYTAADLTTSDGELNLDFVQSKDVLYITNRSGTYKLRKLTRTSSTSWAFSTIDPDTGPFLDQNATDETMYASGATGSITITASSSVFTADHVGALIRIDQEILTSTDVWVTGTAYSDNDYVRSEGHEYQADGAGTSGTNIPAHTSGTSSDGGVNWEYITSGYGIGRITAQAGTSATVTVLTPFPQTTIGSGNASTLWRFGAWSDADGYPEVVTFFKERLGTAKGERIDLSVSGDFENFGPDSFGVIDKTSALSLTVQSDEVNDVVGLVEGVNLAIFTEGAEFVMNSLTTTEAFGPGNVQISRATAYGARPVRPRAVGEAVLYVQASSRKVREIVYDIQVDTLVSRDMTIRSEHLARPRITAMARQEEPYQVMWFLRSDGVLLCFTYDRTQEVRGWTRIIVGGSAEVESVSVIPSPDGTRDDVWIISKRTINGMTKRYVERIEAEFVDGDDQEDAFYVDAGLTYDGAAATEISGLHHLEGQTVNILSDGAKHPTRTVSEGSVTLDRAASVVQIGLANSAKFESFRAEAGAADGTAQTKTKRITDCAFRVLNTLGGKAGPSFDNLDEIPDLNYRPPSTPMDTPPPLFTGDTDAMPWPEGYETAGRICYENADPFPCSLIAIVPQVVNQDSR